MRILVNHPGSYEHSRVNVVSWILGRFPPGSCVTRKRLAWKDRRATSSYPSRGLSPKGLMLHLPEGGAKASDEAAPSKSWLIGGCILHPAQPGDDELTSLVTSCVPYPTLVLWSDGLLLCVSGAPGGCFS